MRLQAIESDASVFLLLAYFNENEDTLVCVGTNI
jgi:hypothetical protein